MRRVSFNDTEGLTFEDLNMLAQLSERAAYRALREQIQTAVDDAGANVPLWVSGTYLHSGGSGGRIITFGLSVWCAASANPIAALSDVPEVYFGEHAGAAFTLDPATSGAVYRRDIVQVKIDAESLTGSETRDFKDAVTGVVTTQSFTKRRVRTVTMSVKKGTDQASEVAANANEPAPDAGYTKIHSFLIDNTSTSDVAKDKRYAVGYRRRKRLMMAATATPVDGSPGPNENTYTLDMSTASDKAWLQLEIAHGRRIRKLQVRTDTGLASQLRMRLIRDSIGTSPTTIVELLSTVSGGVETLSSGELDELVSAASTFGYVIEMEMPTAGDTSDFGTIYVTED